MAKQKQTTENVPASVAAPKTVIDDGSGAQPEAPTSPVKVEGAASAPPSTDVDPREPSPAASAVAAAPSKTLDVRAAEEELVRQRAELEEQRARHIVERDEMLREFDDMLVKMETMTPPAHLSREEVFDELMRVATEVESELSQFATDADPVVLERMAMISQRIRRRASDFGAPPPAATKYRSITDVRYALNGTIHKLAKDSIVSDATHDLSALRAANAQLEEVSAS